MRQDRNQPARTKGLRFRSIALVVVLIQLSVIMPALSKTETARIKDVTADLPYKYDFNREFIVAGERVLVLQITNNTSQHIAALEIEIRLRDAFGDVVTDWSSFIDPELQIAPGVTRALSLKLTKQNILGAKISNVLDQARYADVRYARILFTDGTLLDQADLYPELAYVFGSLEISVRPSTNLQQPIVFVDYAYNSGSNVALNKQLGNSATLVSQTMTKIQEALDSTSIFIPIFVTNRSETSVKKDLTDQFTPGITFIDDRGTQYSNWALVLAPQPSKNLINGREPLQPGITVAFYYVFDKIDNYTPKELRLYINGKPYPNAVKYPILP